MHCIHRPTNQLKNKFSDIDPKSNFVGDPILKDIRRSHQRSSVKLHKTDSALDTQERGAAGEERVIKRIQHWNEKVGGGTGE
jgi:hypothetical protein